MKYEYGIAHHTQDIDSDEVRTTHRQGMTEAQVDKWISGWEDDGGKEGAFVKIRRPVSDWEIVK